MNDRTHPAKSIDLEDDDGGEEKSKGKGFEAIEQKLLKSRTILIEGVVMVMRPTCARFRGRRRRGPLQFIPLLLAMLLSACGDDGVTPNGDALDALDALIGTWELVELDGGVPRTGETWTFTATTAEFPGTGQCIVINTYTRVGSTLTFTISGTRGLGCSDVTIGEVTEHEATVSGDTLTIVTDAPVGVAHHISTPPGHLHVRVFTRV